MHSNSGLASINGQISELSEARIPILDRGFLHGDAIFESFVAFGDEVFDIQEHLERLQQSAKAVLIDLPLTLGEFERELLDVVCMAQSFPKKNIRLIVTRGIGMGMESKKALGANRYIIVTPAAPLPVDPLKLKTFRTNVTKVEGTSQSVPKVSNYQEAIVATTQAKGLGFDEILWVSHGGEVLEAATANIFFVARRGEAIEIATPSLVCGILDGITRRVLLDLMKDAGIKAWETTIGIEELPRFDEAFLCSTVRGLVPVQRIDQHQLHAARPNSVFRQIERLFMASVTRRLGFSVDWSSGIATSNSDNAKPLPV